MDWLGNQDWDADNGFFKRISLDREFEMQAIVFGHDLFLAFVYCSTRMLTTLEGWCDCPRDLK